MHWCLAFLFLGVLTMSARSEPQRVVLLHTNDIHGHVTAWHGWEGDLAGKSVGGFDRLAAAVAKERAEAGADGVLLLDAGDAIGDTMLADLTQGTAVLDGMAALRYDAMALGNHEPDFGVTKLRHYIEEGKVPLLAANVRRNGESLAPPFRVTEAGGVKVGLLALAYPNTPLTTASKNVEGLAWEEDSAAVVRRFLPTMRAQHAQLIVVLSHLGLGADQKLAEAVPEIDVIVGGHSHNRMKRALVVGSTLIVQAGAHLSDLGVLELEVEQGKVTAHKRRLIPLTGAADPAMTRRIEDIRKPFVAQLEETLGEATGPIVRAQTLAGDEARKRHQQSPADSLFADIVREQTGSEIALLPGVGYGVALSAGPITAEALRNLLPHDGRIVTMTLTGAQVREILQQAVENTYSEDPGRKVGGMIQVSGLTFSHDSRRVLEASLSSSQVYRVATNSMLAEGGHRYATFLSGKNVQKHGSQFEMIAAWVKKQKKVNAPGDTRISLESGPTKAAE